MPNCLYCGSFIENPKFCNNSCAASYNNTHRCNFEIPKKMLSCSWCGIDHEVDGRTSQYVCESCKELRKGVVGIVCEYGCNQQANYKLRNGRYCCSRSYNSCEFTRSKNAEGVRRAYNDGRISGFGSNARFKSKETRLKNSIDRTFSKDTVYTENTKRYFIEICCDKYACSVCGISKWQDNPIVLELDHIDGNRSNNCLENLRLICPNCHSQTVTFKGRNINQGFKKVSDEVLFTALKNSKSIHQALSSVGLAPKGGNYTRAKKLAGEMKCFSEK